MHPSDPDERLVALFRSHYDEVYGYCARRIGYSDADEVTAEVFAVAWRRIDEIDWNSARPWLYGIARGVLANRWRSLRRRSRLAERLASLAVAREETPEVYVVRHEESREAIEALRKLKRSDSEILMLAAWEGLTASGIAAALGISNSAAEQRLHRAKKRYAQALGNPEQPSRISPRAAHERGGR